jgi:hypothetical protein
VALEGARGIHRTDSGNCVGEQGCLDPARIADSTEGGIGVGAEEALKGLTAEKNAKAANKL